MKEYSFFECGNCLLLVVMENATGEPLQFSGHMGFGDDGSQQRKHKVSGKEEKLPRSTKVLSKKNPRFDVTKWGAHYFKYGGWLINGPNDDMPTFWYSEASGKTIIFNR